MIKPSSPKALLITEALFLPLLMLIALLCADIKVAMSLGVGFFVCFFSNFLFYGCILLEKKAKSAMHELGRLYVAEFIKIALHFALMVLVFNMPIFSSSALAAGVLSFYLLNIVLTIMVGMNWSVEIGVR